MWSKCIWAIFWVSFTLSSERTEPPHYYLQNPIAQNMLEMVHNTFGQSKWKLAMADGVFTKSLMSIISSLQQQPITGSFQKYDETAVKTVILWAKMYALANKEYLKAYNDLIENQQLSQQIMQANNAREEEQKQQILNIFDHLLSLNGENALNSAQLHAVQALVNTVATTAQMNPSDVMDIKNVSMNQNGSTKTDATLPTELTTKVPTKTPTNVPTENPTTAPIQQPPNCTCAGGIANARTLIEGKICGCLGTFDGSTNGTDASQLCDNNNFEICGEDRAIKLGLNNETCAAYGSQHDELFFWKGWKCGRVAQQGSAVQLTPVDVYACGNSAACSQNRGTCADVTNTVCTIADQSADFDFGWDNQDVFNQMKVLNASRGGVLCCLKQ